MSDLVERLKAHDIATSPRWPDDAAMYAWMDTADDLLSEAAAEITRLQKALETARDREQRLQAALSFWMPQVSEAIEVELNGRAGDDAMLLYGYDGELPDVSWGEMMVAKVDELAAKLETAREDALEALLADFEALDAARHLMLWMDGYSRPTEAHLLGHCKRLGKQPPEECRDVDHVPPKALRTLWILRGIVADHRSRNLKDKEVAG